jgi:tetratricopeptide (TPR) repeat protein
MKFYKYTPALLEPKIFEETLVGRNIELDNLKRILKDASSGRSISHAILVGPKGIGKTHILRTLYYAVRGEIKTKGLDAYKKKFIPIIFSEEEYIGDIIKFFLLVLRYLRESESESIPPIPLELIKPATLDNKQRELALSYFKTLKQKTGKILLLLVDNLNDIIERFTVEDQSSLREALMTYDSILLIGSAPTLFDSIVNHDRPLYNFFEIIWLKDLPFEDTATLLKRYATIEGKNDLIDKLNQAEAKLKAIHELTGGNPRLILSLYHIIIEGDISSIETTFLKLLDELSPYFRERMKDLSSQQRDIIDAVAQAEKLLTPTEMSSQCYMPVNVVNSQLKRLEKIGYVRKSIKKGAKRVFYDLNEKLFSLWRQMRVEAGKRRLGFIVKFLEIWFTKDELLQYLDKPLAEIHEKLLCDDAEIECDLSKLWYIKESLPEFKNAPEVCVACNRGDHNVALGMIQKALRNKPHDVEALSIQACIYDRLKDYNKAIEAIKKAVELKPDDYRILNKLGGIYFKQKEYEKALELIEKAIEINPADYRVWNNLGSTYLGLKQYDKAIEAAKKVIEIKPDFYIAWDGLGRIYSKLGKNEEAIGVFKKAIEVKPNAPNIWHIWHSLGAAYLELKRYDEALEACNKALEFKHDDKYAWYIKGLTHISLFVREGVKENIDSAMQNVRGSLSCLSHVSNEDAARKDEMFNVYVIAFKNLLEVKKLNILKVAVQEIEKANQNDLLKFLSPYAVLIRYIESKDKEIIERLRYEERIIIEEMLKIIDEKSTEHVGSSIT